ncbi:GST-13 protein, partial [Aphelenchoides avenae]
MPHGLIPVLFVDGKPLGQSVAIMRYVAKKFGLAGKGDWEQAKVDEILDLQKDFYNEVTDYILTVTGVYAATGVPTREPAEMRPAFLESAHKYLSAYDRQLKASASGFFMESGLTVADLWVADFLFTIKNLEPEIIKSYPVLEGLIDRVYSLPRIKEWVEKRPKTSRH